MKVFKNGPGISYRLFPVRFIILSQASASKQSRIKMHSNKLKNNGQIEIMKELEMSIMDGNMKIYSSSITVYSIQTPVRSFRGVR